MKLENIKNRIVERLRCKPGELLDHPSQAWEHPKAQAEALSGVLRELGQVDTLKAYHSERAGGALVCIDGHLRRSLDPALEWDVDVLDLSDSEADYMLAVFDPVGSLKVADKERLASLLSNVQSGEAAVQKMLADEAVAVGLFLDESIPDVDFKEYDESVENEVEYLTCPECGHKWPK